MPRTAMLVVLFAACGGERQYTPSIPHDSQQVAVRRLDGPGQPLSSQSGFDQPRRDVIRDQAAWEAAWNTIYAHVLPRPPMPAAVDFGSEMVLLAAMGQRSTGGYEILIDCVVRAPDGSVIAAVTQASPASGCALPQVITAPVDAVVVPRAEVVAFAERSEVHGCR